MSDRDNTRSEPEAAGTSKPVGKLEIFGALAQYESARDIFQACEKIRDAGYKHWDAHTPYPVHGLPGAMGLGRSHLGWIVLVMGLCGASTGLLLQWWVSVIEYPIVISGKPLFSWPAFVPIIFEIMVLFCALGAVFGMFGLNRLPQYYHSLFRSSRFDRVTDDKFFVSIEARDPNFDPVSTLKFLEALGATHVEVVEK